MSIEGIDRHSIADAVSTHDPSFVWKRHVGALPRGTNMAAVKRQKHLSVSFTIKTKDYSSRVPTH